MDTSMLAFPKPKDQKKNKNEKISQKSKKKVQKEEFCIMPESDLYETKRRDGLVRHEVFFGAKQRKLSIKYGLVIFITPEKHNMSNDGIHFDKEFCLTVQKIAQETFMKRNKTTREEFIRIFGKDYL